jgi:hypothetical protein
MATKRERELEDALNDVMDVLEDHDLLEPPDEDDEGDDRGN